MSSFLTDSTNSLVSGGQFGDVLLGPFGSGILGWFWTIVRTLSWHRSIHGLLITADESTDSKEFCFYAFVVSTESRHKRTKAKFLSPPYVDQRSQEICHYIIIFDFED